MTSTTAPARPDIEAFEAATRTDVDVLIKELRAALGPRLVAMLAGVAETRAVHQWAAGTRKLGSVTTEQRLRLAYQLWKLITTRDSNCVARAWFSALNPKLDDTSPARLVRDGDFDEVGPRLLAAARSFAATGV